MIITDFHGIKIIWYFEIVAIVDVADTLLKFYFCGKNETLGLLVGCMGQLN